MTPAVGWCEKRWAYSYDAFGRRISKHRLDDHVGIAEQTLFTWDGDRLIDQARTRAGTADVQVSTWDYLPGSWRPIGQSIGGTEADAQCYAVVSDLMGMPTELVTADGSRVAWSNADATISGAPRTSKAANDFPKYTVDCPIRFPAGTPTRRPACMTTGTATKARHRPLHHHRSALDRTD